MTADARRLPRFETAHADRPPDEIAELGRELAQAAAAATSEHVPISARAHYLRAQDAHRRAVSAHGEQQPDAVHDALVECRSALEAMRARLQR
jgi:hypothetical protein